MAEGPVKDQMATDTVERGSTHLEARFFFRTCLISFFVGKENVSWDVLVKVEAYLHTSLSEMVIHVEEVLSG